jgi:Amt family ammonium transporter
MKTRMWRALGAGALASLALPAAAMAQDEPLNLQEAVPSVIDELNVTWIILATCLVMFMQAGFLLLEVGFSRGKNAGSGVAKILANFSLATIAWWACGFALAFGGAGKIAGDSGFAFNFGDTINGGLIEGPVTGASAAFFLFQFMFCAVSLAIVWGTTLERIKFIAYVIYAVVFAAVIYPLIAHWIFGGGFLSTVGDGVQDFAGSTVVHLTGATGGLAALILLGARRGKFGPDGRSRAIPGHSMPLFGLGVLVLWLGWFGFNAGSTLGTGTARFAEVAVVTQLGAAAGVIGASIAIWIKTRSYDVGMAGNGAIAGLVGITAPSGYVEFWAAPIIGLVAGVLCVVAIIAIDKKLDDPVGALSAHGIAGVWGTLACGIFTSPRLAEFNGIGKEGLVYSGSFEQLGVQAVGVGAAFAAVFAMSYVTFLAIQKTVGLRVTAEEEDAGLDISEHGMYGYPEQFIPAPELVGYSPTAPSGAAGHPAGQPSTREVTA